MTRPAVLSIGAPRGRNWPVFSVITSHRAIVGRVFAQARPKLPAYTHIALLRSAKISLPTLEDLMAETRMTYDGPVQIGENLMAFDIGEMVTVRRFNG